MKTKIKTIVMSFAALMLSVNAIAFTDQSPEDTKSDLVADWERAKVYTLEYIDAMPADAVNFSPTEGIRTFAQQMLHIANANVGIMGIATGMEGVFEGNIEKDEKYQNKKAMRDAVVKSYDACIQAVKDFDMSTADEQIAGFGGVTTSRMEWLKKNFEHQTHHRGQTTIYLRMKGVTPPAEKLF
jgi:uncharacterized damage-inducible protein DinB